MNANTATDLITANKGSDIEIVLTDGSSVYGTAFSVNSKGVNVKDDDGKTRSVGLGRIDSIEILDADDTFGADDTADDDAADAIEMGDTFGADDNADDAALADMNDDDDDEIDTEVDEDEESFMDDAEDDNDAAADLNDALNDAADAVSDGASTAEIAAILSDILGREITAKELRVHLRALGLGVGKGRKYVLSAGELRAVHGVLTAATV